MHPLNISFFLIIYSIAFFTAYLIKRKHKIIYLQHRYESIDGLRGFLALSVFVHHSAVWYFYISGGVWEAPASNLYKHFGQSSVSFFFMITSFLFVSKLLHSDKQTFDWKHFFISRLYRLIPLYYFSLIIIIIIITIISNFQLNVGLADLFKSVVHWLLFCIIKTSYINDIRYTAIINSGVVWSLPYEWFFYFSLPVISILIYKKLPTFFFLLLSISFMIFFYLFHQQKGFPVYQFLGGAIPAYLNKYKPAVNLARSRVASGLIFIALYFVVQYTIPSTKLCTFLLIIIFTLIAMGNTCFGLLRNSVLKFLSEVSYSTYLLHGIILFITFYFVIGLQEAKELSSGEYCSVIFLITPVVIIVSFLGYRGIEKPFMDKSKSIKTNAPV